MNDRELPSERAIGNDELFGWMEFACWTMLCLSPWLYWANGPAVSTDQLVIRTALVALAAVGALALRIRRWRRTRQANANPEQAGR
jgi:MYXO-CTERM domain-containing protein